ncbi:MAG TPA: hypothetical protein VGR53_06975 [Nitrososphaerales archaeon]|nr:hypothetical protein [Nitrososphaerales archaeon]
MSERFWTSKYSEVLLLLVWSLVAALIVEVIVIVPVLFGLPGVLSVLVGLGGALVIPLYLGDRILKGWDRETAQVAQAHPFLFLKKVRSLKRTGYFIEAAVILVSAVLVFGRYNLAALFSGALLYLALLELWPIELVFLLLQLNFFWTPASFDALRASLRSDSDPEKDTGVTWLDDSILYFNRLSTKSIGLTLSRSLSPDVLLFGSTTRSLRITMLLGRFDSREDPDYLGFITDLSSIARKPIAEIIEKESFFSSMAKNKGTILGFLGVVVPILFALSPYVIPYFVNPIISQWSQLFH